MSQSISYGSGTLLTIEFALIMGTKLSLVTKLLFLVRKVCESYLLH